MQSNQTHERIAANALMAQLVKTHTDPKIWACNYISNLKNIYHQSLKEQQSNWRAGLSELNLNNELPHALGIYLTSTSTLNENELPFLDFLITLVDDIASSSEWGKILIHQCCIKKNQPYLQWLLEKCHFKIEEGPYQQHPISYLVEPFDSEFNFYFLNSLHQHTEFNDTPLILAARYHHNALFEWVAHTLGDDLNEGNARGLTPLVSAIVFNNTPIFDLILQQDPSVLFKEPEGFNAFHATIFYNKIPFLCKLIKKFTNSGRSLDTYVDKDHNNLLHYAITSPHKKMLPLLLRTMDPLVIDTFGRNLALFACAHNQHTVAKQLIIDYPLMSIRQQSSNGLNALQYCVMNEDIAGIEWLLSTIGIDINQTTLSNETALIIAAKIDQPNVVKYLIFNSSKKEDMILDAVDDLGQSYGHYLAQNNQYELINTCLIKNKLNIAQRNYNGDTLLDIALAQGASHRDTIATCVQYLLGFENHHKKTRPLSFTSLKELPRLLEFFCQDALGTLTEWIQDGQPVLHLACLNAPKPFIQHLIKTYALDVNQKNKRGETPLAVMLNQNLIETVLWFCQQFKPKLTELNSASENLLMFACEQEQLDVLTWCIHHKKLPLLKPDQTGLNALDLALMKQNLVMVQLIWQALTPDEQQSYVDGLRAREENHARAFLTEHGLISIMPPTSPTRALNPLANTWIEPPICYTKNPMLRALLDEISNQLNASDVEGYLYGSSNYKIQPNDFDILLPNIVWDEHQEKVHQLLQQFIDAGAIITAHNPETGEYGYKKINRHIIPMRWRGFSIEWSISEKNYLQHGQMLDFTVGALYFNLREKKRYAIEGMNACADLNTKTINTIINPMDSFLHDPSRIFRAIRLMADEGFSLSIACEQAIHAIFSNTIVPFRFIGPQMTPGKLYQQLDLLFKARDPSKHLQLLNQFDALLRLYDDLLKLNTFQAHHFLSQMPQVEPFSLSYQGPACFFNHQSPASIIDHVDNDPLQNRYFMLYPT